MVFSTAPRPSIAKSLCTARFPGCTITGGCQGNTADSKKGWVWHMPHALQENQYMVIINISKFGMMVIRKKKWLVYQCIHSHGGALVTRVNYQFCMYRPHTMANHVVSSYKRNIIRLRVGVYTFGSIGSETNALPQENNNLWNPC